MKFSDIEKVNVELIEIKLGAETFHVTPYLSISNKYDIVMDTLAEAEEPDGFINEVKLDMFLHLNLVYQYTDIEFAEEDKQNPYELYDVLETTGIITNVVGAIGEEYQIILDYLLKSQNKIIAFNNSVTGAFKSLVHMLPEGAAAMQEIMDNFDPEKYNEVMNFASAIGMKNE